MTTSSLLTGFACILLIQFASTLLVGLLGINFPPALLGMILLAILLLTKSLCISTVEDTCTLLLEKMGMLFVPAGVSILLYTETIAKESFAIFATIIISSMIVMIVTGLTVDFMLKRSEVKR